MRSPTIRDVAREAGVGIGTVSRVLNNNPRVSPETRQRVLDAIQSLGFRPNQVARQLSRGKRARSIGIISPFVTDHSFMARLHGVQNALAESQGNYDLVFYHVATPERYNQRLLSIAEQRAIEGLLIMAMDTTPEQRDLLNDARIVFVGIHDRVVTEWPSIGTDNLPGGEMATSYLLDLGHTRIAYIGDSFPFEYGYSVSEPRYNGYIKALVERGIPVNRDYVQFGPHVRDIAYQLTRNLLTLAEPPTAIFCMSDVQALGCLAAIRDAGLHVPDEISLIGFDDVEISSLIGLTTIRQHLDRAGCMGMEYLLKLLGDESLKDHYVTGLPRLPSFEVIERQTTRRIR